MHAAKQTDLVPFDACWAANIFSWVQSSEELRWWSARDDFPLQTVNIFETWHADPDVSAYVLLNGSQQPVGYGEVWSDPEENSVELARLIIAPSHRRQKFASHLIDQLLARPEAQSRHPAWVRVVPSNLPAVLCYQSVGFIRATPEVEHTRNQWQRFPFIWMSR